MNSKPIAVLAVLVMALSGATLVYADQADATEDVNLGTINMGASDTASVTLKFNETAYKQYHAYTVTMRAANSEAAASGSVIIGTGAGTATVTEGLTVQASGSEGTYNLAFTSSGVKTGSYSVYIQLDVTVEPIEEVKIALDPIVYKVTVSVGDTTVSNVTLSTSDMFTVGQHGKAKVTATDATLTTYTQWYAIGLPEGLNVRVVEGAVTIVGMPTTATETTAAADVANAKGKDVTLVGRDDSGNEVSGTLKVVVNPASSSTDIDYTLVSGDDALSNNNNGTWVAKQNQTVTLKITGADSAFVTVIDSSGARTQLSTLESTLDGKVSFTVPTVGVGAYTIEMSVNGTTMNANLYVIPALEGAGAGFAVAGN